MQLFQTNIFFNLLSVILELTHGNWVYEMLLYDMRNFHCVTNVETEEHVPLEWMDELGFYVPSTVFQSFRDDGRVNMKGSVQLSAI